MRQPHAPVALLLALAVLLAACARRDPEPAAPTVTALTEDQILLSRVLERCNANPAAVSTPECSNARAAADRLMADRQAEKARQAEAGFERAREARRRADEAAARSRDATPKKTDVYDLPVEGVEPPRPAP